jgi:protoheme IX farnesyltransferase
MNDTIKRYVLVAKPGIVCGNLIAATGGFLLASGGQIDFAFLSATLLSISLIVASACVFNNCIDRDLDGKMGRTRNRVLPQGLMSQQAALCYGSILGLTGFSLLVAAANVLSFVVVLGGFAIYVVIYSLYLKRNSYSATIIGSLAGAAPAVAGYCAVRGRFDPGAAVLLLIFCLWQIPHSYAIAINRLEDYRVAAIPVLPLKLGTAAARRHIIGSILAFTAATLLLTFCGYTGYGYLTAATVLGLSWFFIAWTGPAFDERLWGKKLFSFSLLCIVILSVMMAVDSTAPLSSVLQKEHRMSLQRR